MIKITTWWLAVLIFYSECYHSIILSDNTRYKLTRQRRKINVVLLLKVFSSFSEYENIEGVKKGKESDAVLVVSPTEIFFDLHEWSKTVLKKITTRFYGSFRSTIESFFHWRNEGRMLTVFCCAEPCRALKLKRRKKRSILPPSLSRK